MSHDPLPPYRVVWRAHLTTGWTLLGDRDTREEADTLAIESMKLYGGYCRLIAQHVVAESERPREWTAAP